MERETDQGSSPDGGTGRVGSGDANCGVCWETPGRPGLRRCARMIAESPLMLELLRRAMPIAASSAPLVITGETGTGKEILARAVHASGPRRERPFVAVNVAALPGDLLESEMFGYARGAFTGAHESKQGLIRAADGGTLLLDEVAEMPRFIQAKLLRVLDDGEVRPLGDTRSYQVDVRLICATHQNLEACVAEGRFRDDLYHRLSVLTLHVPPLRDRVEDVLVLAEHFLDCRGAHSGFTAAAQAALRGYAWPGNVRELNNAAQHGAVFAGGGEIGVEHLPAKLLQALPVQGEAPPDRTLAEVERAHILRVFDACGGRPAEAARILGIGRNTLWRKLRGFQSGAGRTAHL